MGGRRQPRGVGSLINYLNWLFLAMVEDRAKQAGKNRVLQIARARRGSILRGGRVPGIDSLARNPYKMRNILI
jgi:hypothetical protein